MNPFPTRNDELIQAALDGELTNEQQIEFGQLLERDADARHRYESLQRLTRIVDEIGLVPPPPDLAAATAQAISLRKKVGVRSVGTFQGERVMAREAGLDLKADDDLDASLAEREYLRRSIGRAGLLALRPLQVTSHRDSWHRELLKQARRGPRFPP